MCRNIEQMVRCGIFNRLE